MRENIQREKTIDVHAHMVALGSLETEEKYKDIMPRLSHDAAGLLRISDAKLES